VLAVGFALVVMVLGTLRHGWRLTMLDVASLSMLSAGYALMGPPPLRGGRHLGHGRAGGVPLAGSAVAGGRLDRRTCKGAGCAQRGVEAAVCVDGVGSAAGSGWGPDGPVAAGFADAMEAGVVLPPGTFEVGDRLHLRGEGTLAATVITSTTASLSGTGTLSAVARLPARAWPGPGGLRGFAVTGQAQGPGQAVRSRTRAVYVDPVTDGWAVLDVPFGLVTPPTVTVHWPAVGPVVFFHASSYGFPVPEEARRAVEGS
jgi:hypothetical protein